MLLKVYISLVQVENPKNSESLDVHIKEKYKIYFFRCLLNWFLLYGGWVQIFVDISAKTSFYIDAFPKLNRIDKT